MALDPALLARIQFGSSIGFHYIFPQTSLGLALLLVYVEARRLARTDGAWEEASRLLVRLLALVFAFGVATGLVLPFSLGMHWGGFSLASASVFGTQLALEAVTSFTLEAGFLAILAFGRDRVSRPVYLLSACLVLLGTLLSACLVISANSWMETPAGYAIEDGVPVLADWARATFNPSFPGRLLHGLAGALISGAFFAMAVAALLLRRGKAQAAALRILRAGAALALALALAQPFLGLRQVSDLGLSQPIKLAAFQGRLDHSGDRVWGDRPALADFPREDWPPVAVISRTYPAMEILGLPILVLGAWALLGSLSPKTGLARGPLLRILPWGAGLPYLANLLGWMSAEMGRQPWAIWGILRTGEAISPGQSPWVQAFTLGLFLLTYAFLGLVFVLFLAAEIRHHGAVEGTSGKAR